jgi:hypothetical protein
MMTREAFDELCGFDESLPACEDYDLWLRASLRYEIHTMPEKLIVKRGGHPDQLSRGWGLDRFRVRALEGVLCDPMLTDQNRKLVLREIAERSKVVEQGAAKRGNVSLKREFEGKRAKAEEAFSSALRPCPSR